MHSCNIICSATHFTSLFIFSLTSHSRSWWGPLLHHHYSKPSREKFSGENWRNRPGHHHANALDWVVCLGWLVLVWWCYKHNNSCYFFILISIADSQEKKENFNTLFFSSFTQLNLVVLMLLCNSAHSLGRRISQEEQQERRQLYSTLSPFSLFFFLLFAR